MVNLFSAPALFICFRETLEAVLVISIMLQICDKLDLKHLKKQGAQPVCSLSTGASQTR